jgi:hypothetical protein
MWLAAPCVNRGGPDRRSWSSAAVRASDPSAMRPNGRRAGHPHRTVSRKADPGGGSDRSKALRGVRRQRHRGSRGLPGVQGPIDHVMVTGGGSRCGALLEISSEEVETATDRPHDRAGTRGRAGYPRADAVRRDASVHGWHGGGWVSVTASESPRRMRRHREGHMTASLFGSPHEGRCDTRGQSTPNEWEYDPAARPGAETGAGDTLRVTLP